LVSDSRGRRGRGELIHKLTPEREEVEDMDTIKKCIEGLFEVIFGVAFIEISEASSVAVMTGNEGVS
jgi:hypothetical protein